MHPAAASSRPPGSAADAPIPALSADDALLLDFDGTLVAIAPRPEDVRAEPGLTSLLGSLQARLEGALGIVTGRRLQDVDGYLAPLRFAGAGLHGAQLRREGGGPVAEAPADPRIARIAGALRKRFHGVEGILVEDKGAAVALHYRLAPAREADCRAAMADLIEPGLHVVPGHCVLEARSDGISKAHALRALCAEFPFRGRRPVMIGDDRTDEDGFSAAAALGGYGIKVGPGDTKAAHRLADVPEVHAWLRRGLAALDPHAPDRRP